jgi:branched-chain amino acid transport system permease protein
MFSTYIAWALMQAGLPYWVAFVATIGMAFATGAVIHRVLIRRFEHASVLSVVVVFVGMLAIFNSVAGWMFSYTIKSFPSPFPSALGSHYMSAHELGAIGVMLIVLALLTVFFRYTSLGLAMRATSQNPVSSRLVGIRVGWMLALGWGLAGAIGAVAGMMVAPVVFLDPNMMSGVLLYAFAAALVGGIDNPVGAVVGGFLVGVLESLLGAYVIGNDLKLSVALVLIVGVLIVRPAGLLGTVYVRRV